ncbi:MAG: YihY/virulence factor BrkB family protein [Asticcacaulis sp.]|nr:YihY/virulence factor BrkB family protein [Asticcacaulis sp.]
MPDTTRLTLSSLLGLFRTTFTEWNDDEAPRHGAALAFYAILSLGPLLLIAVSLAGLAFGHDQATRGLLTQLGSLVGQPGSAAISDILTHSQSEKKSTLAAAIGIATLLVSATGFFAQLQMALNDIWNVPKEKTGWLDFVKKRLLSFGMILGICLLLLFSLLISAALAAITDIFGASMTALTSQVVNVALSLLVSALLFAVTFKVLPDTEVRWREAWVGGAVTAVLFAVGKSLIGLYLGRSAFSSTYGAAGSLIVLLVWIYYSAQIYFFGAEFAQVYGRRGATTEPWTGADGSYPATHHTM